MMTAIAAARGALPDHRYPQPSITDMFVRLVAADADAEALLRRFHAAAGVRTRHLVLELDEYFGLDGFGDANTRFISAGLDLAEAATRAALDDAGLTPADVDLVLSASVTGVAAPSLEARLVPRLGFREDVKRLPVFGLGCVAGAAGLARLHDYLVGHPDDVAVLLAVELCSLTVQRDDTSTANMVASGLFGDGAAAVVAVGERRADALGLKGPRVCGTRSRLYPDTEDVMGWDVGGTGFKVVLARSVADVVRANLGGDVAAFLAGHGLRVEDVASWVTHPGGPRVLEAVTEALGLPADALAVTWESLARVGNLSSASVLHVLADTMNGTRPDPGTSGLLTAMGPGFCAELVLLEW
jgi:alkylresorcinol/alkylpyrone synthase